MNRFLKVFSLVAIMALFTYCKNDDDTTIAPPRDYTVQYATEKLLIENYLDKNYIKSVSPDMDIIFDSITDPLTQVSIRNQTTYPLQSKLVTFENVQYTIYYLTLRQGVGLAPTRGDNVLAAYTGRTLTGLQFDANPFPQDLSSLHGTIKAWQEIIPLFREGIYSAANPENPATFTDFGAGVMFLPSALGYYNSAAGTAPGYSSMIFTFKLFKVQDSDVDGDGLTNRQEIGEFDDVIKNDTDGDGTPNYLDTDDDGDGALTFDEIYNEETQQVYSYEDILQHKCTPTGPPRHLDPACNQRTAPAN